ncbi:MAG: manganese efflux pump [Pseudomonadota bacterium]
MFFEIIIIGLILSADSFSAAVAMGTRKFSGKDALKFAFTSGIAEGLVALFGAFAGGYLVKKFSAIDHWVAFGLLMAVAIHMAYEGIVDLVSKNKKAEQVDFHSFFKILIVSLATSLDAFGVGIGLGVAEKPIALYIISIAFWAFAATIAGLYLAKKLSDKFGSIVTLFGAIVLAIIAFEMLKI